MIAELREMVSEREALVKKLVVSGGSKGSRRSHIPNCTISWMDQNLCVAG